MVTNKDNYLRLRQSLDSFVDVAMSEFGLIEMLYKDNPLQSEQETKNYSDFVVDHVKQFLDKNRTKQRNVWNELSDPLATIYREHAAMIAGHAGKCGPGYIEVNGVCVRIS